MPLPASSSRRRFAFSLLTVPLWCHAAPDGRRTRIEGHVEERFNPGLVNASGCDGLRIAAKDEGNFRNLDVPRARLAVIEDSRGVTVDGVTFKDAQF